MSQNRNFKWKHFEAEVILLCVRWYCGYHLSYRNLVEMMEERGLSLAHTTILRWVHEYGPKLQAKATPYLRVTNRMWKVYEVMIKVRGHWVYLYRAIDSDGKTLDFMVSPRRNKTAAKRFFKKILKSPKNPDPKSINVDKHAAYPPAFLKLKKTSYFNRKSKLTRSKYENNLIEQDHRFIKKIITKGMGFASLVGAAKTIAGVETIHMLRKHQTRRHLKTGHDRAQFVNFIFGIAV
jgi:IS6 family transposase